MIECIVHHLRGFALGLLKRIQLKGFKSIKSMDLELRALNVMIGANGSGKSNLISYFKLLNAIVEKQGGLRTHVMSSGYAEPMLYYGSKVTQQIEGRVEYENSGGKYSYSQLLELIPVEQLGFNEERLVYRPIVIGLGGSEDVARGQQTTALETWPMRGKQPASTIAELFKAIQILHLDDTSASAGFHKTVYREDSEKLAPDGRNIAAVLHRIRAESPKVYERVVSTIRLIAPYFGTFKFKAVNPQIVLNWFEKDSDVLFGPHQISDGTLRAMCLITLLLLPDDQLPSIIIVDEPELGLHPYAIEVIASLFKSAAERTQVLISTQSTAFLNHFEPEDIIVVDRVGKESRFSRPDPDKLREWLEDYTLGEVWEKNVIGGGPH